MDTSSLCSSPSIVLIGSRGCGKRTLAFIGALHLGKRLVIADQFFETVTGLSRVQYLEKYGEKALQNRTVEVVLEMLLENEVDCVIECGMSSLNTDVQKVLAEYKRSHPVIYIMRRFEEIRKLLHLGAEDAERLRGGDSKHRWYSNFEYYNIFDSGSGFDNNKEVLQFSPYHLKDAEFDFCHFLDLLMGPKINLISDSPGPFDISYSAVEDRLYSYALTVRLSELIGKGFDAISLGSGTDAIRLVIDTKGKDLYELISRQIAWIRRVARAPIVYEVIGLGKDASSTISFVDSDSLHLIFHGIRNCVEYVLVNLDLPERALRDLISQKSRTKVIGYFHDQTPAPHGWKAQTRQDKYQQAKDLGCDLVQLTQIALTPKDNEDLLAFVGLCSWAEENHLPLIAYNTGPVGRSSLVFNKILTPVRPELCSAAMGESLITAREATKGLFATFTFDSLKFYHFGASVSWSPFPPAMHNAAYHELGLQHSYQVFETTDLQDIDGLARAPDFGGASISLPFKSRILSSIDVKSTHAKAIGAINTLLPLRGSSEMSPGSLEHHALQRNRSGSVIGWYGDNTDWLGIYECVHRNLSPRNTVRSSKTTSLIIGAGGAARAAVYALIQMGCRKILIFNRTTQHAEELATHFNAWMKQHDSAHDVVRVIKSINDEWPANLQPATIIISCIPAHSIDGHCPANLTIPENWLQSKTGGVVADVS